MHKNLILGLIGMRKGEEEGEWEGLEGVMSHLKAHVCPYMIYCSLLASMVFLVVVWHCPIIP